MGEFSRYKKTVGEFSRFKKSKNLSEIREGDYSTFLEAPMVPPPDVNFSNVLKKSSRYYDDPSIPALLRLPLQSLTSAGQGLTGLPVGSPQLAEEHPLISEAAGIGGTLASFYPIAKVIKGASLANEVAKFGVQRLAQEGLGQAVGTREQDVGNLISEALKGGGMGLGFGLAGKAATSLSKDMSPVLKAIIQSQGGAAAMVGTGEAERAAFTDQPFEWKNIAHSYFVGTVLGAVPVAKAFFKSRIAAKGITQEDYDSGAKAKEFNEAIDETVQKFPELEKFLDQRGMKLNEEGNPEVIDPLTSKTMPAVKVAEEVPVETPAQEAPPPSTEGGVPVPVPDKPTPVQGGAAATPTKRFEAGKSLSKEDRSKVIRSIVDVYKGQPLVEKGWNKYGDPIMGYEYNPDLFVKSDITGRMVRRFIKLPDGRVAHPSELYPEMTDKYIDRAIAEEKYKLEQEKLQKESFENAMDSRIGVDKNDANVRYGNSFINSVHGTDPYIGSYFAQDANGRIVRVEGNNPDVVSYYESKGFKKITEPVSSSQRPSSPRGKEAWEKYIVEEQSAIDEGIQNSLFLIERAKKDIERYAKEGKPIKLKEAKKELDYYNKSLARYRSKTAEQQAQERYDSEIGEAKSEADAKVKKDLEKKYAVRIPIQERDPYSLGLGSQTPDHRNLEALVRLAGMGGEGHAQKFNDIAQRGRVMESSTEHMGLWNPLEAAGYVERVREEATPLQLAQGTVKKLRGGGYRATTAAGMEVPNAAYTVFRLTEKGWQRANDLASKYGKQGETNKGTTNVTQNIEGVAGAVGQVRPTTVSQQPITSGSTAGNIPDQVVQGEGGLKEGSIVGIMKKPSSISRHNDLQPRNNEETKNDIRLSWKETSNDAIATVDLVPPENNFSGAKQELTVDNSRLEVAVEIGRPTIAVRKYDVKEVAKDWNLPEPKTPQEEWEVAKFWAGTRNDRARQASIQETTALLRRYREMGVPDEKIEELFGKRKLNAVDALSNLNPDGKFMSIINSDGDVIGGRGYFETVARWVGDIRKRFPDKFTNKHEDEIYDYLAKDRAALRNIRKEPFTKAIERKISDAFWKPETDKINIDNRDIVTGGRILVDEKTDIGERLVDARKRLDEAITPAEKQVWQEQVTELEARYDAAVENQPDLFAEPTQPPAPEKGKEPPNSAQAGEDYLRPTTEQRIVGERTASLQINRDQELRHAMRDILGNAPARTVVRELFQNSIDANAKNITITLDKLDHKLTINDDGIGMSADDVQEHFLTLGNLGTKNEESAGGYGRAKAAFLLYPEKIQFSTAKDGVVTSFSATSEELFSGKPIVLKSEKMDSKSLWGDESGTNIILQLPKEQKGSFSTPAEHADKAINEFINLYRRDVKINFSVVGYGGQRKVDVAKNKSVYKHSPMLFDVDGSSVKVTFDKQEKDRWPSRAWPSGYNLSTVILNKGIPIDAKIGFTPVREIPDFMVTVDFTRTPKTDSSEYPFINNRQELIRNVQDKIQENVNKFLDQENKSSFNIAIEKLQKEIDTAPSFGGVKVILPDIEDPYARKEIVAVVNNNRELVADFGNVFRKFSDILKDVGEKEITLAIGTDPKVYGWRPTKDVGLEREIYAINPFVVDTEIIKESFSNAERFGRKPNELRASGVVATMLHEYTHNFVGSHGEDFSYKQENIYTTIGYKRLLELETAIEDILNIRGKEYGELQAQFTEVYKRLADSGYKVRAGEVETWSLQRPSREEGVGGYGKESLKESQRAESKLKGQATQPPAPEKGKLDQGGFVRLPSGEDLKAAGKRFKGFIFDQPEQGNSYKGVPTVSFDSRKGNAVNEVVDTILKGFAPAARGKVAQQTSYTLRESGSKRARTVDIADRAIYSARKYFDKNGGKGSDPKSRSYQTNVNAETGDLTRATPEEKGFVNFAYQTYDKLLGRIQELGSLEGVRSTAEKMESGLDGEIFYMGRIWKNPTKAQQVMNDLISRKPFEGGKKFLRQRTLSLYEDGIKAGLEPLYDNPTDMFMHKVGEMTKWIQARDFMNGEKEAGRLKFVKVGHKAPEGWSQLNDKMSTVYGRSEANEVVIRGHYYAPEASARVFNNLVSEGLSKSILYRGFRQLGNTMNQWQLGLSAFHAGFTSLDAMVSSVALANREISRGQIGRAALHYAETPIAAVTTALRGRKYRKEWFNPGSTTPEIAAIVNASQAGGSRARIDSFYKTEITKKMLQAFRRGDVVRGTMRLPFAAMEQVMRPIMEHLVPNQKWGVLASMMKSDLANKPDMTHEQLQKVAAKNVDSVDNRLGQMIYDNLFWNKILKDMGMASVRSLGWNLGTIREVVGGVIDIPKDLNQLRKTGEWNGISNRTAYLAALPMVVGAMGAITQYLATGESPQELKDYYFPKIGGVNNKGVPNRVSLPSYMKDIYHYTQEPVQTVKNKLHPLLGTVADMLNNQDYYGVKIRNEDDPIVKQALSVAEYGGKQFAPFTVRNIQRNIQTTEEKGVRPYLSTIGITPAPRSLSETKAERIASEYSKAHIPAGGRTQTEADKSYAKSRITSAFRSNNPKAREMFDKAVSDKILVKKDLVEIRKDAREQAFVVRAKKLSLKELSKVVDEATPEERKLLRSVVLSKKPTTPEEVELLRSTYAKIKKQL